MFLSEQGPEMEPCEGILSGVRKQESCGPYNQEFDVVCEQVLLAYLISCIKKL